MLKLAYKDLECRVNYEITQVEHMELTPLTSRPNNWELINSRHVFVALVA